MTAALDLADRVVVVTGSTSGIGEAVARRLAACGAAVVVNSARSAAAGRDLAEELPDALYVGGDIADPGTAGALVRAVTDRWGRLDGLVNNAAVTTEVPLHDIDAVTPAHWERVLSVNVIGTFLVSQAALPLLRESDDGWIINVTSIAGVRQTGSSLPYAVSKAAVDHLTTLVAKFAGGQVRVNAVAPGATHRHGECQRPPLPQHRIVGTVRTNHPITALPGCQGQTVAEMLLQLLGPGAEPFDLRFTGPGGGSRGQQRTCCWYRIIGTSR